MSLLKDINNTLNLNELCESAIVEGCGMSRSENEEYSTLSTDEILQLVQMVLEHMTTTNTQLNNIDAAVDFAYDLVNDIPGLEDEHTAKTAVEQIINAYKRKIA